MMFTKSEPDKGELEIVYDVQWKTPGNDDDKAKIIGIVDTSDTNLDWNTFKSYLIQNSGNNMRFTTDDIRISYIDSDDDLIPVDSEIEFRECLKFSRTRARRGRKIMMKVTMIPPNVGTRPKEFKYGTDKAGRNKLMKPRLFCLKKKEMHEKLKAEPDISVPFKFGVCEPPQGAGSSDAVDKEKMPEWFENYMAKFKTDLVQEITTAVVTNIRSTGPVQTTPGNVRSRHADLPSSAPAGKGYHHHHHHLHHVLEKRKKKKKMPEEDSSDCTDGLQLQCPSRDDRLELLRQMQKIHKRDKKFEKKLDHKLEKLESKSKKIMEKKMNLRTDGSAIAGQATNLVTEPSTMPSTSQTSGAKLMMDASPLDAYNFVPHVLRGEIVEQVWMVMNSGQLPWTDETELRFAWGSKSLIPLNTVIKCPNLNPGDTGKIKVSLQAPMFPGTFESYWHFHHQSRRFGHWLGLAVIVDPEPHADPQQYIPTAPVDLTMKCSTTNITPQATAPNYDHTTKSSTTDDMKIYNIEANPEPVKAEDDEILNLHLDPATDSNPNDSILRNLIKWNRERLQNITLTDELNQIGKENETGEVEVADLLNMKEELGVAVQQQRGDDDLGSVDTISAMNDLEGMDNCVGDDKKEDLDEDKSVEENAAEYISGSDTDNISIISAYGDSEPSDEFVVVPMPTTCINCEQSIDSQQSAESQPSATTIEYQPISIEIPQSPSDSDISAIQASDDNNNNTELKPFPEMPQIFLPILMQSDQEPVKEPKEPVESLKSDDENTVYVRDASGKSVPVAKVLKTSPSHQESPIFGINVSVRHNTFGDPNFGHGPNGPRFPFGFNNDSPPICLNPGGACNFRPQHESPVSSHTFTGGMQTSQNTSETFCSHFCQPELEKPRVVKQEPKQKSRAQSTPKKVPKKGSTTRAGGQDGGPSIFSTRVLQPPTSPPVKQPKPMNTEMFNGHQNIHTEQPRPCKYSYVFSGAREMPTQPHTGTGNSVYYNPSGTRRSTTEPRETSPVAAAVQILPDSLVTGAVNVASSAINTARSVIDMLRPRQDDPVMAQWEQIPPEVERSLATLQEMGFNNRELNIMLLAKYNNDVLRVIFDLI